MYPFDGSDLGSGPGRADVPRPKPTDSSDAPCPLAASACPDGPETSGLRRVRAPGTHDRAPRAVPATTGRTVPLALTDHELAASLARGAGEVLLAERAAVGASDYDGRALKDRGDRAAHEFLVRALAHVRPDDAVLSEEGKDDQARLDADRVWIVDPLDGTREFAERDADGVWRDDWAVHVALWTRDEGLTAGAVALPARDQVLATGPGAVTAAPSSPRPWRVAVSRTRPPGLVERLAARTEVELVAMGSAGVKTMSVVVGDADVYLHGGGQYEWDSAAPVAVARAAGLVTTRLDGSPLAYNRPDPWLPDLLVCRPGDHEQLAGLVHELLSTAGNDE